MAEEPAAIVALVISVSKQDAQRAILHLFEAGAGGVEERDVPGATELWVYGTSDEVAAVRQSLETTPPWAGHSIGARVEPVASDWESRWAECLEPVKLSEDQWVAPEGAMPPGSDVIVLRRRMAFGFGDHPTTRMAARAVVAICRERPGLDVLDFGTGGGLLALVAERTGARQVLGLDNDPKAVAAARENARLNGARGCRFETHDVAEIGKRFDLVVANVDLSTLAQVAPALAGAVAPRGTILLTGVLTEDESEVERVYGREGFILRRRETEDDWLLLDFVRAGRAVDS